MAETRKYNVTGMSCDHCETAVREELADLIGIEDIQVSAATGSLVLRISDGVEIPDETIVDAVDEAGYPAERVH